MAEWGRPLFPWQGELVTDALGMDEAGAWTSYEVVELLARQNGKGVPIEALELFGLFVLRKVKIVHSAHRFATSQEAFKRLIDLIENCDWLRRRVKSVSTAHGEEGLLLLPRYGGGELLYKARSAHGVRGFSGDTIVLDEAYGLTVSQFQAISPILATWPDAQIIYASSPPDEKTGPMPDDALLPSVRARGIAGDPRMTFYEWSPDPDDDPEHPDTWAKTNPSMGHLISEQFLANQLKVFKAAGKVAAFATEHCGAWPPTADEQWLVIAEKMWEDRKDERSRAVDPVAIGIDTTGDRMFTSVAIVGRREDGLMHGQLAEHGPGTGWVVDWVRRAVADRDPCAVVVGANGPARSLIPALEAADIELITPGTADVAGACGALFDAIAGEDPDGRVFRHRGQGPLTAAVAAARKRNTGDAFLWQRAAGVGADMSPLYAVTLAYLGYQRRAGLDYDIAESVY